MARRSQILLQLPPLQARLYVQVGLKIVIVGRPLGAVHPDCVVWAEARYLSLDRRVELLAKCVCRRQGAPNGSRWTQWL